jgi:dipeptidyl aminopeptidase/acylaminoacyl peptidase
MVETPNTRASLLIRLRDPRDERAWSEFVDIYEPFVLKLVYRRGLRGADADDLAQEVFVAVAAAIGRWDLDPARGSAFGPDGATLAAVGLDGEHSKELKLWDTASGRALATLPGADSHSVAYSPDGRTIATGDLSGGVQIWSVAELLDAGAGR